MNNDWTKEKDWAGDKEGIINRFKKKRWEREGYNMSTFLHIKGVSPDNNDVERTNRVFVSIKMMVVVMVVETERLCVWRPTQYHLHCLQHIRSEVRSFLICCARHANPAKTTESFVPIYIL